MKTMVQAVQRGATAVIAPCILTIAALLAPVCAAHASGAGGLTGDWGGARDALAATGINVRADATLVGQGVAAGAEDRGWDGSGRGDLFVDIDSGHLGLWRGTGLHTHGEIRFADPQSNFGGQLLSSNTGALTPLTGTGRFEATSIYISQRIDQRTSLLVGKINVIDLLAADPVFGGWGTRRFMNLVFVAPPSGVVPVTIMGGALVHRGRPIDVTVMVFDPNDRTGDYWIDGLFADGMNISVGGTWNGRIAGRPSSIGFTSTLSTQRGQDLGDVLLPPGLESSTRKGSYNIGFQARHLLVESPLQNGQGLTVSVRAAIADGNPNVIEQSAILGIAGHGMIRGRPDDSFGAGAFYYKFSDVLQDTLSPVATFRDERGVEAWYSLAPTPWLRLTTDVQLISPARGRQPTSLILAIRGNIAF
jgi:porin